MMALMKIHFDWQDSCDIKLPFCISDVYSFFKLIFVSPVEIPQDGFRLQVVSGFRNVFCLD